jgi:hypothetical protein
MTTIGNPDSNTMLKLVRRLCGHDERGPTGVFAHSIASINDATEWFESQTGPKGLRRLV